MVEICDALHAWLSLLTKPKGKILDAKEFRDNMDALRAAAELESWPHNGLRHSFGSYHLAYHGDAVKTAQQMGHRSSDVVHNHYKALVLKKEAERFWNLKPKTQEEGKKETPDPPLSQSNLSLSSRQLATSANQHTPANTAAMLQQEVEVPCCLDAGDRARPRG